MTRVVWPVLALGLLSACAGGAVWTKAGVSEVDFKEDQQQCYRLAYAEAERERYRSGKRLEAPVIDVDASGRIKQSSRDDRSRASLDEQARRDQLFGQCLHSRGYRLQKPGN